MAREEYEAAVGSIFWGKPLKVTAPPKMSVGDMVCYDHNKEIIAYSYSRPERLVRWLGRLVHIRKMKFFCEKTYVGIYVGASSNNGTMAEIFRGTEEEYKEAELTFARKQLREAEEVGDEAKAIHWQGIIDELGGRGPLRKFLEKRKG